MRDAKLARLEFRQSPTMERASGSPANFLPQAIIDEFEIPDAPPVSAHPYLSPIITLIADNKEKLFLDVGAGLRRIYHHNVVNTEIYPSVSTDVLCIGESMPFADQQFDFVFCFATLEHTKRPWDVAAEIRRVLKPGGMVIVDYPFLQPVHGYPHHYFNATPMGHRSLFEEDFEVCGLEMALHHHPILALQWSLVAFRNGLPPGHAAVFENLRIKDLVEPPVEVLIDASWSRALHPELRRAIASGSMVIAVKRAPDSPAQQRRAEERGRALADSVRAPFDPKAPDAPGQPWRACGAGSGMCGTCRRTNGFP